ncbi:faeA-like family protein [Escherichia coli]|uniref:FaeA/PapI family transcriptional regulator n=1 Tax=Escherichia coli TaxID=562 RepID=UPI001081C133|nr:FaeA/PapI family transcriptional regulator [Escherichia coli]EFB7616379.1 faeA-like family protein [Escherichia coli]EHC2080204.1 faeA-like family protein [Escherichia coli]EIP9486740.1 faeA-like family protein [Escherichia coli]EJW7757752.1 faeA-like family protein [Escherichia coli]TGH56761.1 faeA-like family protein [Escherichia coli]
MKTDIDERMREYLENQKKHFSKTLFSTREIADAVGLTIYQVRGYLEMLQSSGVVEKVNSGRGRAGQWTLL